MSTWQKCDLWSREDADDDSIKCHPCRHVRNAWYSMLVGNQWFCGGNFNTLFKCLVRGVHKAWSVAIVLSILTIIIIKHGLHVCVPGPRYPRAAASLMIIIWFVCQHSATSPRAGDRDRGNFKLSQSAVSHLMDLGNMNFQNLFLKICRKTIQWHKIWYFQQNRKQMNGEWRDGFH